MRRPGNNDAYLGDDDDIFPTEDYKPVAQTGLFAMDDDDDNDNGPLGRDPAAWRVPVASFDLNAAAEEGLLAKYAPKKIGGRGYFGVLRRLFCCRHHALVGFPRPRVCRTVSTLTTPFVSLSCLTPQRHGRARLRQRFL